MVTQLVTCLCVTHDRMKWMPWVTRMMRTRGADVVVFVDSSEVKYRHYTHKETVIQCPAASIAVKRNIALESVETPYFAWFDDDDWSHPERLERCVRILEASPELVAVGPVNAYKIDARTLASTTYSTNEHLIFNGAVYRTEHWKQFKFAEQLAVGEDTDWQKRGLRGQAYGVVNKVLSAWLCHGSNIANRSDRIMFTERFPAQLVQFREELESNPEYNR